LSGATVGLAPAMGRDAGRRHMWITPCKPKAQLGVWLLSLPQPRSGLNCYAVLGGEDATPRAALRLQGVIHIECLRHSCLRREKNGLEVIGIMPVPAKEKSSTFASQSKLVIIYG
jgi:hypothetical protein